jgi:Fe2+ or Zn2+ uptake regulation protein
MSFGTVYRNLQVLVDTGEIIAVKTDSSMVRYDRRRDNHHHLYCRKCGRVFDSSVPYRAEFDGEAQTQETSGFIIEGYRIAFVGLCPDCQGV